MMCWYTLILLPSSSDSHKLFMKCLAIEKRKCGGYFQTFLQSLEDKVKLTYRMIQYTYVYCILEYNNDQFIMIDCCADCVLYTVYMCRRFICIVCCFGGRYKNTRRFSLLLILILS